MNYTIQVPASSIQKASQYGANVIIIGSGVSFADGTTVTSTLGAVISTTDPAYTQANVATNLAQSSYDFANTLSGGSATDNVARVSAQAAFNKANTVSSYLDANTIFIAGVNAYQNSRIDGAYTQANNATNFFKGTTGSASPTNGSITLNSTTGMTFSGSGNTISINTPQSLSTTSGVTFNSLTLTNALPITQGGTGGTSASAALTNLLPTGTTSGYVLTTGGPGTFYWAAGGGGGSGATPGTTISSTRLSYTANGSGLAYTTPTYVPGASQLRVYFDGLRQFASEYTETSATVCTFNTVPASGVVILFEVDGYINNPYYANNISFTAPFGSIVSTANTIQLAIQDLETRKATLASPALTGTPTAPTPIIANNNTQIATTAYVNNLANSGITFAHNITGSASSATTAGSATTASSVTNGVYTSSSYSDPSWITSLSGSKISGSRNIPQATLPAGSVLQVVQVVKTNQYSVASGSPVDVPGLAVSITPTSTSSKILVIGICNMSTSGGGGDGYARLMRNYAIGIGNGDSGYFGQTAGQEYFSVDCNSVTYLDSPNTTSSTTYNIQVWGANVTYVNGRGYNGDFVTSSSLTLMEIAG